jgi:hypothetical protein
MTKTEMPDLTRPIVGIEHRTAQEVFDIMADRIRSALVSPAITADPVAYLQKHASFGKELSFPEHPHRLTKYDKYAGWSETPLYAAPTLETVRRETLEEENVRLLEALREIGRHPSDYDDGTQSYSIGWAFHNVQHIAREALRALASGGQTK